MPLEAPSAHAADDELFALLSQSARRLAENGAAHAYLAWLAEAGPRLAPGLAAGIAPGAGPPTQAWRSMGVAIYNAMPQAVAGFRPRKLSPPGRNDPCQCGSGRKYKQCCLQLAGALDLAGFNLLRFVLDELPAERFGELPGSRVDLLALADTARQWLDEDRVERAVALLEPWFAGAAALDERLEYAFDQLMDAYLALGEEGRREALIDSVLARGAPALRAAALHRRSTMQADRGDDAGAWASLREAMRADPDNPNHATLEMGLLVSRGEFEQARARARYWIARLERLGEADHDRLLDFLHDVEREPQAALARRERGRGGVCERLARALFDAPAVAPHYAVRAHGEAGSELVADDALREVEQGWRAVYVEPKPLATAVEADGDEMWAEPARWLDFLERTPLAWHSFDVLDDLVLAVDALQREDADAALTAPLCARVDALMACNGIAVEGSVTVLPWRRPANRPLLRLLAYRSFRALDEAVEDGGDGAGFVALARRLLALDPADAYEVRIPLSSAYLDTAQPAAVLELPEPAVADSCTLILNRLLALLRLRREDEARELLQRAAAAHAPAIEALLAAHPRRPKATDTYSRAVSAVAEAWHYQDSHRPLWEQDGATAWLRTAWRGLARRGG